VIKFFRIRVGSGETGIFFGRGLFEEFSRGGLPEGVERPEVLVTNTIVDSLWGRPVRSAFDPCASIALDDGEWTKSWDTIEFLAGRFLEKGVHRGHSVLALGGGVISDITGFAASIFMRGISWAAVPTTLLAMVDASIGGKTGINLDQGKNLLGTFWPPRWIFVDPTVLDTLPSRELRSGLAELIKAAWIGDRKLEELLAGGWPMAPAEKDEAIERGMLVKIGIVEADERESGRRKALNLGHTLGHALESLTSYRRFLHGEAVIWGMKCAAWLSLRRDLLPDQLYRRRVDALDRLGDIPPIADLDPSAVVEHISRDKKRDDSGVAWVLPTPGGVLLDQRVPDSEIREFLLSEGRRPGPS